VISHYPTVLNTLRVGLGEHPDHAPQDADFETAVYALDQLTALEPVYRAAALALKHDHMATGADLTNWEGPRDLVRSFFPEFHPAGEGAWVESGKVYHYKNFVWYGEHAANPVATPHADVPEAFSDAEYAAEAVRLFNDKDNPEYYATWAAFLAIPA
jgi:hypothetical protein